MDVTPQPPELGGNITAVLKGKLLETVLGGSYDLKISAKAYGSTLKLYDGQHSVCGSVDIELPWLKQLGVIAHIWLRGLYCPQKPGDYQLEVIGFISNPVPKSK